MICDIPALLVKGGYIFYAGSDAMILMIWSSIMPLYDVVLITVEMSY